MKQKYTDWREKQGDIKFAKGSGKLNTCSASSESYQGSVTGEELIGQKFPQILCPKKIKIKSAVLTKTVLLPRGPMNSWKHIFHVFVFYLECEIFATIKGWEYRLH